MAFNNPLTARRRALERHVRHLQGMLRIESDYTRIVCAENAKFRASLNDVVSTIDGTRAPNGTLRKVRRIALVAVNPPPLIDLAL